MSRRESDKKQVCNLCKKALELNDDRFNALKEEINRNDDPVIKNLCDFLERKRGAF